MSDPTLDQPIRLTQFSHGGGCGKELLRKGRQDSIILHSLPRMDELPVEVDETRHQRYWIEAFNGVVVRMALLALVLGAME